MSSPPVQKRPEKELVLTNVIENAGDKSQYPRHFPIGKHMGIEFSITVIEAPNDKIVFLLHAGHKGEETKNRPWEFPCRYSFQESFLKRSADVQLAHSCKKILIGETTPKGGSVKFEIRIWVPDCLKKFDDPSYSDASILVDGEEFMVSKLFLSSQCTFFDSAFKWAAEQGKEPKITEDTFYPYEVQNFLEMIHGEIITKEDNIATLLEMSRYFDSAAGIRRCTQFLMGDTKMHLAEKYRMAERFAVEEMKKLCLERVRSFRDLKELLPLDLSTLDKTDLCSFLQKSMELHRQAPRPSSPRSDRPDPSYRDRQRERYNQDRRWVREHDVGGFGGARRDHNYPQDGPHGDPRDDQDGDDW